MRNHSTFKVIKLFINKYLIHGSKNILIKITHAFKQCIYLPPGIYTQRMYIFHNKYYCYKKNIFLVLTKSSRISSTNCVICYSLFSTQVDNKVILNVQNNIILLLKAKNIFKKMKKKPFIFPNGKYIHLTQTYII